MLRARRVLFKWLVSRRLGFSDEKMGMVLSKINDIFWGLLAEKLSSEVLLRKAGYPLVSNLVLDGLCHSEKRS